jgi:serine protease Do
MVVGGQQLGIAVIAVGLCFGSWATGGELAPVSTQRLIAQDKPTRRDDPITAVKKRDGQVTAVVGRVLPAVVAFRDGRGSGVVVSRDGHVLTAGHVFWGDKESATLVFPDGKEVEARWLGVARDIDAGMLKIIDPGVWPHVELGQSESVQRGDWCISLGHPGGYSRQRSLPVVRVGRVQHANNVRVVSDGPLRSGDSGGPLVDLSGKLIGIHSQIQPRISDNRSVAVGQFRKRWKPLASGQRGGDSVDLVESLPVWRSFGVELIHKLAERAEVVHVEDCSPAADAGVRVGDVITAVDGEAVTHREHAIDLIADKGDGKRVRLTVTRDTAPTEIVAVVRARESSRPIRRGLTRPGWGEQDTRTRRLGIFERQEANILSAYSPISGSAAPGIVSIEVDGKAVCLGTVVDRHGGIVTCAGELGRAATVTCTFADGTRRVGKVDTVWDDHGLVLVRTEGRETTPARLGTSIPKLGTALVSADQTGRVLTVGALSALPRSLLMPYLGVSIDPHREGVVVRSITKGSTAELAKLVVGDIIVAVGDTRVTGGSVLSSAINAHKPGDLVEIRFLRNGEVLTARQRMRPFAVPDWFRPQEVRLGAVLSRRILGFTSALQHDSALLPEQCGGPLLDLDGNTVAINVARSGRVESFAVPASVVRACLKAARSGERHEKRSQ